MRAVLPAASDEQRLIAASVAASVALHAAVLAVGPWQAHPLALEPPQVLSVVLVDATPEAAAPAAPPPPATPPRQPAVKPAARAAATPAPSPRSEPPPVASVPAASEAPPVAETGPREERSVAAPGPPAMPPGPTVAAVPRESPPDFRAAYLRNPPPGYPAAARRNGEEGTVTLRVLVSAEGAPREVALERSSGSSHLDAAALATVKTWRFSPARHGGQAQEAWVLVPIVFRLEPRG